MFLICTPVFSPVFQYIFILFEYWAFVICAFVVFLSAVAAEGPLAHVTNHRLKATCSTDLLILAEFCQMPVFVAVFTLHGFWCVWFYWNVC